MNTVEKIVGLGLAVIAIGSIVWTWFSSGPMPEDNRNVHKARGNSRTGQ